MHLGVGVGLLCQKIKRRKRVIVESRKNRKFLAFRVTHVNASHMLVSD